MSGDTNVCGNCKHWHRKPADPADLGAPPQGDCRGEPPQLVVLPARGGVVVQAMYPITRPDFPACGRFELSLLGIELAPLCNGKAGSS